MNAKTEPQPNGLAGTIVWTFRRLLTKEGILLWSVSVLLIIWGPKGIPLFTPWFQQWIEADPLQSGFRLQLLSFASGVVLLGLIPLAIVHFIFKEKPREVGLGLGDKRLGLRFLFIAFLIIIPLSYLASLQPSMQVEYPLLYQGLTSEQILARFSWQQFVLYEILYGSFFFVVEFSYRGYMLFGLQPKFGLYTIFIQMFPYIFWHFAKPLPELIPTPLWGFIAGAVGLRVRSIWYSMLIHWTLNILMDTFILIHRGVIHIHIFS